MLTNETLWKHGAREGFVREYQQKCSRFLRKDRALSTTRQTELTVPGLAQVAPEDLTFRVVNSDRE